MSILRHYFLVSRFSALTCVASFLLASSGTVRSRPTTIWSSVRALKVGDHAVRLLDDQHACRVIEGA